MQTPETRVPQHNLGVIPVGHEQEYAVDFEDIGVVTAAFDQYLTDPATGEPVNDVKKDVTVYDPEKEEYTVLTIVRHLEESTFPYVVRSILLLPKQTSDRETSHDHIAASLLEPLQGSLAGQHFAERHRMPHGESEDRTPGEPWPVKSGIYGKFQLLKHIPTLDH